MVKHQTPVDLPEGYIDFFKGLESWQNEEVIKLKQIYAPQKMDLIKLLHQERKSLMSLVKPGIDPVILKDLYSRLLEFLSKARPEIAGEIEKIKARMDELDFDALSNAFLKLNLDYFEEQAERFGISPDLFFFLIDHAMRPFLRIFAVPYAKELASEDFYWSFPNTCPICGSKSHFSRLRKQDGQRFMFCDRCFSEWHVMYLCCVHCGHDRPGEITYLNVENDDAYQIYVCEKCKGYLKTYDERSGASMVDMYIANIETIYLDMLAQGKGYTNHDED